MNKRLCYKCLHYGVPVQYRKTTSKCCANCGKCVFFSEIYPHKPLKWSDEWLTEKLRDIHRDGDAFKREYENIWISEPTGEIPMITTTSDITEASVLSPDERLKLIDRLDRSFLEMPRWAQASCKHAMCAPTKHPVTGKEFESFREVIEASSDYTLLTLKEDFADNDDLLPE